MSDNPSNPAAALALLAEDMKGMDKVIERRLASSVPLVSQVSQYIIAAGGKRMRPTLLLSICGALGCTNEHRLTMAAVVEFIHTATLLHDDVVDDSTLRRGRATANEVFGNAASVLVGDFLYSRAFQMMVEVGNMRIMQTLAEATNVIAEGEVLQLMNMHNSSLTEEDYLLVVRSKTAKLFEASARLAALLAASNSEIEHSCAAYGQALGTAFQVIDDVLDYDGDAQIMGKNLGDDLREGKATLPLIIAMQRASEAERSTIKLAIETGGIQNMTNIMSIIKKTDALQATRQVAAGEAQRALDSLKNLPEGSYSQVLNQLAAQLLERQA